MKRHETLAQCKKKLHDMTPDNVFIRKDGRRFCRACRDAYRLANRPTRADRGLFPNRGYRRKRCLKGGHEMTPENTIIVPYKIKLPNGKTILSEPEGSLHRCRQCLETRDQRGPVAIKIPRELYDTFTGQRGFMRQLLAVTSPTPTTSLELFTSNVVSLIEADLSDRGECKPLTMLEDLGVEC